MLEEDAQVDNRHTKKPSSSNGQERMPHTIGWGLWKRKCQVQQDAGKLEPGAVLSGEASQLWALFSKANENRCALSQSRFFHFTLASTPSASLSTTASCGTSLGLHQLMGAQRRRNYVTYWKMGSSSTPGNTPDVTEGAQGVFRHSSS